MHPGLFSSIPPSWRGLIVFIVTVLAVSVLMEKEFPEVFRNELMFKKLEAAATKRAQCSPRSTAGSPGF